MCYDYIFCLFFNFNQIFSFKMAESVRDEIKQHLNQMSFEDIQKLQNKLGLKKFVQ